MAINKINGHARYIDELSESTKKRLYSDIAYYNDKLYFIPMSDDKIVVYDLKTGEKKYIFFCFPDEYIGKTRYLEDYKFCIGCVMNKALYMFSCTFPAILKLDLDTESIHYIKGWVEEVECRTIKANMGYFRSGLLHDGKMILPSCSSNCVMVFDFTDDSVQIMEVGKESYSDIAFMNHDYYISGLESGKMSRIRNISRPEEATYVDGAIPEYTVKIFANSNNLFVLSMEAENSCMWNRDKQNITHFGINITHIFGAIIDSSYIYFVGDNQPYLVRINMQAPFDIKYIDLILDGKLIKGLAGEYFDKNIIAQEKLLGLNGYITYLCG